MAQYMANENSDPADRKPQKVQKVTTPLEATFFPPLPNPNLSVKFHATKMNSIFQIIIATDAQQAPMPFNAIL